MKKLNSSLSTGWGLRLGGLPLVLALALLLLAAGSARGQSWQTVASCGSSIGSKGMILAAKAMSLAGYDLLTQPELLAKARREFDEARNGQRYVTPLPEGIVPS